MTNLGRVLVVVGALWLFWSFVGRWTGVSPNDDPAVTQANFMWRISHGRLGAIVRLASATVVLGGLGLLWLRS